MVNSTLNKTFDLSWGNSVAVRSTFLECACERTIVFGLKELNETNYPLHEGDENLIEITHKVVKRQVGTSYKHIVLTNGAAGGVTIAMRAYRQQGYGAALTRQGPYFPLYPSMIKAAGLEHKIDGAETNEEEKPIALIDSPTNPQGLIVYDTSGIEMPVVWDAVYHNKVYTKGLHKPIIHGVLVGSYSKLLGLNGLRVGWIATNDSLLYERLKELVTAEYSGLSTASTKILLQLLTQMNGQWNVFETNARYALDYNRGEWSKLTKYFGDQEVSSNGMFYYGHVDASTKKLLAKSNIIWTPGSALGTSDEYARFNLGQDCKVVRAAVKEILKNDRI